MAYNAADLLGRGYFPAELPPPFVTKSLGAAYSQIILGVDAVIDAKPPSARTQPVTYHVARQGSLRRRTSIPHPYFQARLCQLVEANSMILEQAVQRSNWSSSTPTPSPTGAPRALDRKIREEKIVEEHARVRAVSRYLVVTDIANCYASIYTHGISWALLGKDSAKQFALHQWQNTHPEFGKALQAARLDSAVRGAQDKQSVGLPVGPDTSLILAEAMLAGVDQVLAAGRLPASAVVTRHVDDYQVGVDTLGEAESVLATLQSVLRTELELDLNPRKTRIVELPEPLEASWVTALKGVFREGKTNERQQRRDLLRMHDMAIAARRQFPEEHVLNYAVGILRKQSLFQSNWALAQHLLFQAMISEPGLLGRIVAELLAYQLAGFPVDTAQLASVLSKLIVRHAPQGHSSEVAWALWAHLEFQLNVSADAADAVETMADPVVDLIALDLNKRGVLAKPPARAAAAITIDDFWGDAWVYAFEALRHGWVNDPNDVKVSDAYRLLADNGVAFYDGALRISTSAKTIPQPGTY